MEHIKLHQHLQHLQLFITARIHIITRMKYFKTIKIISIFVFKINLQLIFWNLVKQSNKLKENIEIMFFKFGLLPYKPDTVISKKNFSSNKLIKIKSICRKISIII